MRYLKKGYWAICISLYICSCTTGQNISRYQGVYPAYFKENIEMDVSSSFDIVKNYLIGRGYTFFIADKNSGIIQTEDLKVYQVATENKDGKLRSENKLVVCDYILQKILTNETVKITASNITSKVLVSINPNKGGSEVFIRHVVDYDTGPDTLRVATTGNIEKQMLFLLK